ELIDETIALEPGDVVVLYTDGVTEAWHPTNGDYGIERLTAAVAAAPSPAAEILVQLEEELNAFTDGEEQQDDVTFLILTRK
ncbi:MAG: regulator, partial [Chloroflexi bacterium]|nr:regulator [Chloroflexota bacterium]